MKKDNYGNYNDDSHSHDHIGGDDGTHKLVQVIPLNGNYQFIAPPGMTFIKNGENLGKIIYAPRPYYDNEITLKYNGNQEN